MKFSRHLVNTACCLLLVTLFATPSHAEPAPRTAVQPSRLSKLLHPIGTLRARFRRERALAQLQKKVRSMPRVGVKFHERFGKLGGKEQFGSKTDWLGLLTGTAINIGGVVDPKHAITYLIASTVVGLGTVATHVVKRALKRRKATISMIEDKTISDTVLKPYREALGLSARARRLAPIETKPETAPEATAAKAEAVTSDG